MPSKGKSRRPPRSQRQNQQNLLEEDGGTGAGGTNNINVNGQGQGERRKSTETTEAENTTTSSSTGGGGDVGVDNRNNGDRNANIHTDTSGTESEEVQGDHHEGTPEEEDKSSASYSSSSEPLSKSSSGLDEPTGGTSVTEEDEDEVVISASLNFGQNSQVEMKVEMEPAPPAPQTPQVNHNKRKEEEQDRHHHPQGIENGNTNVNGSPHVTLGKREDGRELFSPPKEKVPKLEQEEQQEEGTKVLNASLNLNLKDATATEQTSVSGTSTSITSSGDWSTPKSTSSELSRSSGVETEVGVDADISSSSHSFTTAELSSTPSTSFPSTSGSSSAGIDGNTSGTGTASTNNDSGLSVKSAPPDIPQLPKKEEEKKGTKVEVQEEPVQRSVAYQVTNNQQVQPEERQPEPEEAQAQALVPAAVQEGGELVPAEVEEVLEEDGYPRGMPKTVTELQLRNCKVYLVGTAHFSPESQRDVRWLITRTNPDYLFLELCHSRRNILTLDEQRLLRDASDISLSKIMNTLKNTPPGQTKLQSVLHIILLSLSAQLTKKLGMAPGGEFRAAVDEARKLPRDTAIPLLYGDRAFNVTLSRAIQSLTFRQKLKLFWHFMVTPDDITPEDIERCKERDMLESMLLEMAGEFPSITEVFVYERDYYLAHTLHLTAEACADSRPDDEQGVVVGVVGMGHVPGICKNWGTTTQDEFERVGNPPPDGPPSRTVWVIKNTVKLSFGALILYGAYKVFNRVDIFKKIDLANGFKLGLAKIKSN